MSDLQILFAGLGFALILLLAVAGTLTIRREGWPSWKI